MKTNKCQVWVHPDFAKELKKEAIERNKSIISFTKELTQKKSYIEELSEKWKKK